MARRPRSWADWRKREGNGWIPSHNPFGSDQPGGDAGARLLSGRRNAGLHPPPGGSTGRRYVCRTAIKSGSWRCCAAPEQRTSCDRVLLSDTYSKETPMPEPASKPTRKIDQQLAGPQNYGRWTNGPTTGAADRTAQPEQRPIGRRGRGLGALDAVEGHRERWSKPTMFPPVPIRTSFFIAATLTSTPNICKRCCGKKKAMGSRWYMRYQYCDLERKRLVSIVRQMHRASWED